jgi:hypothetical protein
MAVQRYIVDRSAGVIYQIYTVALIGTSLILLSDSNSHYQSTMNRCLAGPHLRFGHRWSDIPIESGNLR